MPAISRGLRQVAQHADDLDRAVVFYRDVLGLRFLARYEPPGLAFLDLGGVRLLLEKGAPSAVLYLAVDELEAVVGELRDQGVEIVEEPHLIFTDGDGRFGVPGAEIKDGRPPRLRGQCRRAHPGTHSLSVRPNFWVH